MRTTLDIDDDVLSAAKELAAQRRSSTGVVVSELLRKALNSRELPRVRNGAKLIDADLVERTTTAWVNKVRDEE